MSPDFNAAVSSTGSAPKYLVPDQRIVSVEHPGIVENIDKAVESLGGEAELSRALSPSGNAEGPRLRLNPSDAFRPAVRSHGIDACNVLLKVSVPKRTGRKRKRGYDDAFVTDPNGSGKDVRKYDAKNLLRALRDNPGSYSVHPVGTVDKLHRFRALPDFQFSLSRGNIATSLRDKIMSYNYEKIKDFALELRPKKPQPNMELIPPPSIAPADTPVNYAYDEGETRPQDLAMEVGEDPNPATTFTRYRPQKSCIVPWDQEIIPTGPPNWLVLEQHLDKISKELIKELRDIMKKRPIITRRVAFNKVTRGGNADFKQALPYVGYTFRSGPWRDAVVQWGLDPRTDRKYATYQTLNFVLKTDSEPNPRRYWQTSEHQERDQDREPHIFDGEHVSTDGSIWQICDITDPYLRSILGSGIEDRCETKSSGWYSEQAIAKVRAVMKDKIMAIVTKNQLNMKKAAFFGGHPRNHEADQDLPQGSRQTNTNHRVETTAK